MDRYEGKGFKNNPRTIRKETLDREIVFGITAMDVPLEQNLAVGSACLI